MARKTKEDAEQTREDILHSALDLFCAKGYSKTTIDDIAKNINLTKGAVYWHFRNKVDILEAIIQAIFNSSQEEALKAVPVVDSLETLKKHFLFHANLIKNKECLRKFLFFVIFQMEWSETIYSKIKKTLDTINEFPLKLVKDTLTFLQKNGDISAEENINIQSEIFEIGRAHV